jgi:uncharacterized FAD-dependent dehydrogenase
VKQVVIVGAGPSGLFAADELADSHNVIVVEKRDFVGGSGLHSDGKLNFHPLIGGDLTHFLPEGEAWKLVYRIRDIFKDLGVDDEGSGNGGLDALEEQAVKAGIRFVKIHQNHIGSDYLPDVMTQMRRNLEARGVEFKLETEATGLQLEDGRVTGVKTSDGILPSDSVLLVPGRIGSPWLIEQMEGLSVKMRYNPIDVGVRVEVPNEVMDSITQSLGIWDPKFHIYTPSYDDFVRTFCVCPRGYVVQESYGNGLFGVNGHSKRDTGSGNTNFALLTRFSLTHPLEDTTEYGVRLGQLANTLGGRKPLLQRLGDLRNHRRSTWERLQRSYVEPTFKNVTPGDISMAYPRRIVRNLLEGLVMLDRVMPGVNSDSTLLYAPEIKFYAMRIATDKQLRTVIQNLYVAGDGSGVSRGIVGAAATGIIAARGIISKS